MCSHMLFFLCNAGSLYVCIEHIFVPECMDRRIDVKTGMSILQVINELHLHCYLFFFYQYSRQQSREPNKFVIAQYVYIWGVFVLCVGELRY